jgi:hypothetical protein
MNAQALPFVAVFARHHLDLAERVGIPIVEIMSSSQCATNLMGWI